MKIVGSKDVRGSTQATIHPLAIILTAALWAMVSIISQLIFSKQAENLFES